MPWNLKLRISHNVWKCINSYLFNMEHDDGDENQTADPYQPTNQHYGILKYC